VKRKIYFNSVIIVRTFGVYNCFGGGIELLNRAASWQSTFCNLKKWVVSTTRSPTVSACFFDATVKNKKGGVIGVVGGFESDRKDSLEGSTLSKLGRPDQGRPRQSHGVKAITLDQKVGLFGIAIVRARCLIVGQLLFFDTTVVRARRLIVGQHWIVGAGAVRLLIVFDFR
jgi:hypothetical protein